MSTDRAGSTLERVRASGGGRSPIALPPDPTDEQLAQDWTLSEADKAEVLRCRTQEHRQHFAVQMCVLREYGRFLQGDETISVRILSHLANQLGLEPRMFVYAPEREVTQREHQQRIREYLGWRVFDSNDQEKLVQWIRARAAEGLVATEILGRVEDVLRSWKVVIPAPSTLERIVAAKVPRAHEEVFDRIAGGLSREIQQAIDDLLEVSEGDRRSGLFRLKTYPPEATAEAVRTHIGRLEVLRSIGSSSIDLGSASPALVHDLAEMATSLGLKVSSRDTKSKIVTQIVRHVDKRITKSLDDLKAMSKEEIIQYFEQVECDQDEVVELLSNIDLRSRAKSRQEILEFAAIQISSLGIFERLADRHS